MAFHHHGDSRTGPAVVVGHQISPMHGPSLSRCPSPSQGPLFSLPTFFSQLSLIYYPDVCGSCRAADHFLSFIGLAPLLLFIITSPVIAPFLPPDSFTSV